MLRLGFTVALLLGFAGAVHGAEPQLADPVAAIDRAIAGNRLIQAGAMLDRKDLALPAQERTRLVASFLLARHHDAEALKLFEAALAAQPEDCRLQGGAGIAALRLGRDKDAELRLRASTAACPDNADTWGALAVVEDKGGRWDLSTVAYARAIALSKDDPALLNNAGVSLISQRRYAEAIRLFRQTLVIDPTNEHARNNLDIARVAFGERPDFEAEIDSGRRAERLNNAGYTALLAGDAAAATSYFDEAIKVNPFRFDVAETNLKGASKDARAAP